MNRQIRFVAYTNDAFGLSAANFHFPIYSWNATSKITETVSSVMRSPKGDWEVKIRRLKELIGLSPASGYLTLEERLSGVPRGYSWKIEECSCLFEEDDNLRQLEFSRDTIHESFSTEDTYQSYILSMMEKVGNALEEYCKDFPEIQMKHPKSSILVLERIDGSEDLASELDNLLPIYRSLSVEGNPLSKMLYDIVWRVESKRGMWEYQPFKEAKA